MSHRGVRRGLRAIMVASVIGALLVGCVPDEGTGPPPSDADEGVELPFIVPVDDDAAVAFETAEDAAAFEVRQAEPAESTRSTTPSVVAGDGYSLLFGAMSVSPLGYTIKLYPTAAGPRSLLETLRPSLQAAAEQLETLLDVPVTVAPGFAPASAPRTVRRSVPGEIHVYIGDTSAPSDCGGPAWGCGVLSGFNSLHRTLDGGFIVFRANLAPRERRDRDAVVAHELGHILGLAHYNQLVDGTIQTMHGGGAGVIDRLPSTYRTGDRRGLERQADYRLDGTIGLDSLGPVVLQRPGGALSVAVQAWDGRVHIIEQSTGDWSAWTDLPGLTHEQPVLIAPDPARPNDLLLVSLDPDDRLIARRRIGGTWSSWRLIPSNKASTRASVVADANGTVHVFTASPDAPQLSTFRIRHTALRDGRWDPMTTLTGRTFQFPPHPPAAVATADGALHLYVGDANGLLFHTRYRSSNLGSAWDRAGIPPAQAQVASDLAPLVTGNNVDIVSHDEGDDAQFQQQRLTVPATFLGSDATTQKGPAVVGVRASRPAAATTSQTSRIAVASGAGWISYAYWEAGGGWHAIEDLGPAICSAPAVISSTAANLDVTTSDNHIFVLRGFDLVRYDGREHGIVGPEVIAPYPSRLRPEVADGYC